MPTRKEKIKNLETILNQNVISLEDRQILLREIARLKRELTGEKENLA